MADQAGAWHQLSARAVRILLTVSTSIRFDEEMARNESVLDANSF